MEMMFNGIVRDMKEHTNKVVGKAISSVGLEFGTITSSGLELDDFKHEIKDYMVLDYLKMDKDYFTQTNSAGEDSHSHKVITPDGLTTLKIGDRVLVAQVGSEFIVIGRVRNA